MMAIENLQRIVPPLTEWFRAFARDLPWRSDPLPYYVWISEIMLQQTRVEAVKPYFRRFTEALPDVKALADCPEEELFKLWEGLGYYSRVRNLKKAAQEIVRSFGGEIPGDYEALLSLPGIGSYTAGAIASIAFRVPVSAVDGNVLRVASRLTGSGEVIDDPRVKRFWEEQLTGLIRDSGVDSGLFNQAMMELGALICLPNGKPDCASCPLKACCRACAEGSWERIPARREKKARRKEDRTVLLIRDAVSTLIHKRDDRGLLAGLWELPNLEGEADEKQVLDYCRSLGLKVLQIRPLPEAKHVFTHVEWHMRGYLLLVEDMQEAQQSGQFAAERFLAAGTDEIGERYPVPSAFRNYMDYLGLRTGSDVFASGPSAAGMNGAAGLKSSDLNRRAGSGKNREGSISGLREKRENRG